MEKEKITTTIVIILCMLAIAIFGFGKYFAIIPLDDYMIYDDFSEGVIEFPNFYAHVPYTPCNCYPDYILFSNDEYIIRYETYQICKRNYTSSVSPTEFRCEQNILPIIENGKLRVEGRVWGSSVYGQIPGRLMPTTITIDKNVKGIDFRFDLGFGKTGCSSCGATTISYNIFLNNVVVYSYSFGLIKDAIINPDMFRVETKSHLLNKDLIDVYVKGVYVNTFNITDEEIKIKVFATLEASPSGSGYLPIFTYIDNIKFKIPFSCKIFEDEHLVYEDYLAGQTIQLNNDFKFSGSGCELKKFCLAHPAVLASVEGTTQDFNAEIYQKLVSGESLTVPTGQNWKLIFIAKLSDTGNCKEYIPKPVEIVKGYCTVDEDCPVSPCTGFYYRCEDNQCKGYGQCIVPPQPKLFWQKLGAIWNSFLVWLSGLWI